MSTSASADYLRAASLDGVTAVRSEVRQRSQLVAVRLTPDEHERFSALAEKYGWSLPHLMRLGVEAALMQEQMTEAEPA